MAAAQAVAAAMADLAPGVTCSIVDVLRDHVPFPFTAIPVVHGPLFRSGALLWGVLYRSFDNLRTADAVSAACRPMVLPHLEAMLALHRPHLLVALHPFLVRPAVWLSRRARLPAACVMTDMVHPHAFWLSRDMDLCFVPSEEAASRARLRRAEAKRLIVAGQPIRRLTPGDPAKAQAKGELGLHPDLPLVLVAGGGDGIGRLEEVVAKLYGCGAPMQLTVVCGRNRVLLERLQRRPGPATTRVLGFVDNMPLWLRAADVLVTKAGPGMLAEAMAEGLPIVLTGAMPGQETDNVSYVLRRGAAVWAPKPARAAEAVARLLGDGEWYRAVSAASAACARPDAAHVIARELLSLLGRAS